MKYKLVAIDLDGTLLTDNKEITEENIKVLKQLLDNNVEVVIATGRRYWSAKKFIEKLGVNIIIMSNNGNIVRSIKDDEVLIKKYLEYEDFIKLIKEAKAKDLHPIIHADHYKEGYDLIIEFDINDYRYKNYIRDNEKRYKIINNLYNYTNSKVLVICFLDDYDKLKDFNNYIKNKYPQKYNAHIMSNLTKSGPILEIMNPLGSKWKTLKDYCNDKNINSNEIIAIGDDNNDIEMIKNAGLGIAMKNSTDKVKKVSNLISNRSNNESGVAYELRHIFKLR